MRRLIAVAAAVLVAAAAALVPLPLVIASPGRLVAAGDVAQADYSSEFIAANNGRPDAPRASYLAVAERQGATALPVLIALLQPDQHVHAARPRARLAHEEPPVMAALIGLGMSPARLAGAPLPVRAEVTDAADPGSLGLALHLIDSSSQRKAPRRRVLGIGVVRGDQRVTCPPDAQTSADAGREDRVDLLIVAADCDVDAGDVEIIKVTTLHEAAAALVAE